MVARDDRPTIAIDIDEVLARSVEMLIDWHNSTYSTSLEQSDFTSYQYWEVWGGSPEECVTKVREFYSSAHYDRIRPVEGAREALEALLPLYRFVVVTSRQHVIADRTREWLDNFFPGIFSDVYFGNHFAGPGESQKSRSKQDMCKESGALLLVDDSLSYCSGCAAAGLRAVLFDLDAAYPVRAHACALLCLVRTRALITFRVCSGGRQRSSRTGLCACTAGER